jgi:hypothetical protein
MLFSDRNVLSNGALVLAASQLLCIGKWIKLFMGTVLAFKLNSTCIFSTED